MTNIKDILLSETSISELPSSFQNLSELRELTIEYCDMLRFPKQNDKMYSIVFSNVTNLELNECNLSDECLPIVLKLFVNVTSLNLYNNNFKIIPECLSECHHLKHLDLSSCTSLEEIRGIPPKFEEVDAYGCKSLSSSSRRMLMSQKLHEAGCTKICLPNGEDGIPDWFEHQSREHTISFWFRKEIPSITCIFILPEGNNWSAGTDVNYFVNGYEIEIDERFRYVNCEHTTLFHMKLNELCNMDKGVLKNEWIHVEFKLTNDYICLSRLSEEEKNKMLSSVQMGIHVWNEKSNTEEENVVFTHPYLNYRNNTSLSPFEIGTRMRKEEQTKTWRTFLSLGASKSNTDGDQFERLSSAQDERKMWGTFLRLGPS